MSRGKVFNSSNNGTTKTLKVVWGYSTLQQVIASAKSKSWSFQYPVTFINTNYVIAPSSNNSSCPIGIDTSTKTSSGVELYLGNKNAGNSTTVSYVGYIAIGF